MKSLKEFNFKKYQDEEEESQLAIDNAKTLLGNVRFVDTSLLCC